MMVSISKRKTDSSPSRKLRWPWYQCAAMIRGLSFSTTLLLQPGVVGIIDGFTLLYRKGDGTRPLSRHETLILCANLRFFGIKNPSNPTKFQQNPSKPIQNPSKSIKTHPKPASEAGKNHQNSGKIHQNPSKILLYQLLTIKLIK